MNTNEISSGWRDRIDSLKSRGLAKVQSKVHDVETGAMSQATKVQQSMRTSPMKWAGIAAGTGFALGLIGRIAQARSKRRHAMPALVIVESRC